MKEQYGVDSMPETGENVAEDFQITRADQDAFALRSQSKRAGGAGERPARPGDRAGHDPAAARASRSWSTATSIPAPTPRSRRSAKLPTPFRKGGTVTAGNASGVNDGAAALIVASEAAAKKHGLTPRRPRRRRGGGRRARRAIMGIGPAPATQQAAGAASGSSRTDFDVIELNEAFAAQGLAVLRELGIADDADARQPERRRDRARPSARHVAARASPAPRRSSCTDAAAAARSATMCIGVGQGIAIALERV